MRQEEGKEDLEEKGEDNGREEEEEIVSHHWPVLKGSDVEGGI